MNEYVAGYTLIRQLKCPLGAIHPLACFFCHFGHAFECHYPLTCEEASCGHTEDVLEEC